MLVYWAMFAVPALRALVGGSRTHEDDAAGSRFGLALVLLAFTILVGARFEVGGDWGAYQEITNAIQFESLAYSLSFTDPGFGLVTWISTRTGLGSFGPSMFCGTVLIMGIWHFTRRLSSPWLALTAAVPYLIIVVGMGYVRQAAAIGFILYALAAFEDGRIFGFLRWTLLAALFHISAIVVLPIVGLVIVRRSAAAFVVLGLMSILLYFLILEPRLDRMYENYIVQEYDSSGAMIRLLMNAVPALMYLYFRKSFTLTDEARSLWTVLSGLSLALVLLVIISPATTALDRIGLYCIPIQLFVFGHIVTALARTAEAQRLIIFLTVFYYGAVLYIWLNYATHASFWLPYKFLPFA